jgi:hypothetical protein
MTRRKQEPEEPPWNDPYAAPELGREFFERAEVFEGETRANAALAEWLSKPGKDR